MRRSGKFNFYSCILFLFFWYLPQLTSADDSSVTIKRAQLALENDRYVLDADVDFNLNQVAMDALKSGIPLSWDVRIRIQQERAFFWNKTVIEQVLPYQIRYYPLVNIYQFKKQENEEGSSFITLSTALEEMGKIRELPVFKQDDIQNHNYYFASIKVQFDREALPLPLRPVSYFDSSWSLSSDWLQWPVKVNFRTE